MVRTIQVPEERGLYWVVVAIWLVFGYLVLLQDQITVPRLGNYVVVLALTTLMMYRLHRAGIIVHDDGVEVRRIGRDIFLRWTEVVEFERSRSLFGPVAGVRLVSGRLVKCLGVAGGSFVDQDIPQEFDRALLALEKLRRSSGSPSEE
jgi:Bacterial PH domain